MSETKTYKINSLKREEIDSLIRTAVKKAAADQKWQHVPAVEAPLDRRYTEKLAEKKGDVAWTPYERYLLSNGHTVYVSIKTMKVTVSDKANPRAVRKVEAAKRRKAEREERKTKRHTKIATAKDVAAKPKVEPKAKPVKRVKFDSNLSTLGPDNTTTPAKS